MTPIFAFTCSCCGNLHEGSPSFGFKAPMHYDTLSEQDKPSLATINDDRCMVEEAKCTR